ncbi:hypothetical protein KQH27_00280 [bacterium]|nr:hypothetical protein [bacterium]
MPLSHFTDIKEDRTKLLEELINEDRKTASLLDKTIALVQNAHGLSTLIRQATNNNPQESKDVNEGTLSLFGIMQ